MIEKAVKILSIVGARPQFIKLAPLLRAIEGFADLQIRHKTLHTGQHYDKGMSAVFFQELEIPEAEINLGVGSGSHGAQTGKMLEGIERVLLAERPDMVIIFGDTNSTVAGALASAKLHIPLAHVEAGLRSFNRRMPEEINRVAADHLSDILLAPTPAAVHNLAWEGLAARTTLTGDIMHDSVRRNAALAAEKSAIIERLQLRSRSFYLATLHRAENTDDPDRLRSIMDTFNEIAAHHYPVVLPIHPRTEARIGQYLPGWRPCPQLKIVKPVGYLDLLRLASHARLALTDSGGLQKEVFILNRPCITLRKETEWIETVACNGNVLTGADPEKILSALGEWEATLSNGGVDFTGPVQHHYGKGNAAEKILKAVFQYIGVQ